MLLKLDLNSNLAVTPSYFNPFFFFRVCAHVVDVFTESYASVYVASRISLNCAQYFTVSESFIWFTRVVGYKVNSTGTEDKSILLKLVSVVHLF